MLLKTKRLTVRSITQNDWKSVKNILEDFNLGKYARYDVPQSTDDASVRARVSRWALANNGFEHMFFAVCLDGVMIGYIAFNKRENGYEIGYSFHSDHHGKGYAKEAHIALFDYFKSIGITKFFAGTAINNIPSVCLLRSLGFKQIATEKVSFYKDENGRDIVFDGGVFELDYGE